MDRNAESLQLLCTSTAGPLEQMALQLTESVGQVRQRVPRCAVRRASLDHSQVVAPVIDRSGRLAVGPLDDPGMLTEDLPLGGDGLAGHSDGMARQ